MRKIIVSSLLAVLLVPVNQAFAQFKNPLKSSRNFLNLSRVVLNKVHRPYIIKSWVPTQFISIQQIELNSPQVPQCITPVTASLLTKVGSAVDLARLHDLSARFVLGTHGEPGFGKSFYDNQTQLARDLDSFYEGNVQLFIGPDGREVKLYALPVDGILYKAPGYKVPVVLNSNEYFVIYDVKAQTGKIAENRPEIYNIFKPRGSGEILQVVRNK